MIELLELLQEMDVYSSISRIVFSINDQQIVQRTLKLLVEIAVKMRDLRIDEDTSRALISNIVIVAQPVLQVLHSRVLQMQAPSVGKSEYYLSLLEPINLLSELLTALITNPMLSKQREIGEIVQNLLQLLSVLNLKQFKNCVENAGPVFMFLNRYLSQNHHSFTKASGNKVSAVLQILVMGFEISDSNIREYVLDSFMTLLMKTPLLNENFDYSTLKGFQNGGTFKGKDLQNEPSQNVSWHTYLSSLIYGFKSSLIASLLDPCILSSRTSLKLIFYLLQKGNLDYERLCGEILSRGSPSPLVSDALIEILAHHARASKRKTTLDVFVEAVGKVKDPSDPSW